MANERRIILTDGDPPPYTVVQSQGRSPFLLTCDHAGQSIPRRLGSLGLPASEIQRHIAWDIGAASVTRKLAMTLDACAILQTYSRLVIDCNRSPEVPSSIATISELTEIPGNKNLAHDEVQARAHEIFHPYHNRIAAELDTRQQAGRPTALVAVHSFTPVFKGVARPWHIGVLYHRDPSLGHIMLQLLTAEKDLCVGDNQPYAIGDATDYGIPVHGEQRGIPHIEFEIRQDLVADEAGQTAWAARLARLLPQAYARLATGVQC